MVARTHTHYAVINAEASVSHNTSIPRDVNLVGWVLESPGRGTLSLIVTCLFTTFLCTWAVIHPRVTRNTSRRIAHKFALFCKAIIAPEFIAVEALQEWSQARKTVDRCRELTNGHLQLSESFYLGMLALRYRTERGDRVIWPNQFQWLLEQRLLEWKDHQSWGLSKENIRDKSNADTPVKLFALLQVSWFVAQSVMRTVHHLPLSQLESMTLSYVPLVVVTYYYWWNKPKDVLTPSVIDLPNMTSEQKVTFENLSVDSTFDEEHTDEQDSWWTIWKLTPRVFEKEAKDKAIEEMIHIRSLRGSEEQVSQQQGAVQSSKSEEAAIMDKDPLATRIERLPTQEVVNETNRSLKISRKEQPQPAELINDSSADPTLVERAIRRATTGFLTRHTTGLNETSLQKKDRILPQYPSETVLAYWDPDVYHSNIWPVTCLFGASFGALHLISWHTVFPSLVETWLWRVAAITSIASMLIFMQYEKVVLKWGGPLTLLSIASPAVYLLSRIIMIGGVIAAFRGMDPKIYDTYVVSTYWVHLV